MTSRGLSTRHGVFGGFDGSGCKHHLVMRGIVIDDHSLAVPDFALEYESGEPVLDLLLYHPLCVRLP